MAEISVPPKKPMKVISADRSSRKGVVCSTFEEFLQACKDKFNITNEETIRVTLNSDGTEIDGDYWETLDPNTVIMLTKGDERWTPETASSGSCQPANPINEQLGILLGKIRRESKPKPEPRKRKAALKVTLLAGWKHFDTKSNKYCQVRKDGGVKHLQFDGTASYSIVKTNIQDTFFPNGKSHNGRLRVMESFLANFEGERITEDKFTADSYLTTCSTQKPRIYLYTKKKSDVFFLSPSSDSDDDEDDASIVSNTLDCQSSQGESLNMESLGVLGPLPTADSITTSVTSSQSLTTCTSERSLPTFVCSTSTPMMSGLSSNPFSTSFPYSSPPLNTGTAVSQETAAGHNLCSTSVRPHSVTQRSVSFASGTPTVQPNTGHDSPGTPMLGTPPNSQFSRFVDTDTPTVSFREQTETRLCMICFERDKSSYLQPCGHTFCTVCAVHLQSTDRRCPNCRQLITKVSTLFN